MPLNRSSFAKAVALLGSTFPDRIPRGPEASFVLDTWFAILRDLEDRELLEAVGKIISSRTTLFPGDNLLGLLREIARPLPTEGDAIELLSEAVSRFGRYREKDALEWLEVQSPLAASAVRRFGFLEYCDSESPEVSRGQFRRVFEEERSRAAREGRVQPSAIDLSRRPLLEEKRGGGVLPVGKVALDVVAPRKKVPGSGSEDPGKGGVE